MVNEMADEPIDLEEQRNKRMKYKNPTLNEREKTHGDYATTASVAQSIKMVIGANITLPEREAEHEIDDIVLESLDLICTKIGRICSGNPFVKDHWDDLAGYANLVSERLSDK